MLNLEELQQSMRESIHSRKMKPSLDVEIVSSGLSVDRRLQIYQNNYEGTLVDSMLGIFPIVTAFVGEVFTRAALKHFIEGSPPREACLSDYGGAFAAFLAAYKHAEHVPYIADIASLEWAVHSLQHALDKNASESGGYILNENSMFIDSPFPLLNLWMVGSGQLKPEAVHVDQGGQFVGVVLYGGEIQLYALSKAEQQVLGCLENNELSGDIASIELLKTKNIVI